MKKILYTIGILMLLAFITKPVVGYGADNDYNTDDEVNFSSERLFSKVISQFGANPSADWFTIFGTTKKENVGKNLYYLILKKTVISPETNATSDVAAKHNLSTNEMEMVKQGNYAVLYKKYPTLTQSQLRQLANSILNEYDSASHAESNKAKVEAEISPNEIFANGDISDSGFDIINDLTNIEKILFLKTDPIDVGKAYNNGHTSLFGDDNNNTSQDVVSTSTSAPVSTSQENTQEYTQENTQAETQEITKKDDPLINKNNNKLNDNQNNNINEPSEQLNCASDNKLSQAINDFEKNKNSKQAKSATIGNTGNENVSGNNNGTQPKSSNSEDDDTKQNKDDDKTKPTQQSDGASDSSDQNTENASNNSSVASADDWKKKLPCSDVFCIFLKMTYEKPTSKFNNTDNCIACHVEKINEALNKVINHSLTPSKIPGNLFETPSCKYGVAASLAAVSMNVNLQLMPIKTPSNDDLILSSDVNSEFKSFCTRNTINAALPLCALWEWDTLGLDKDQETSIKSPTPDWLEDSALEKISSLANVSETTTDIANKVAQTKEIQTNEQESTEKEQELQNNSSQAVMLYKTIAPEMDRMNTYFQNFSDILQSLHTNVPGMTSTLACKNFKEKQSCQ